MGCYALTCRSGMGICYHMAVLCFFMLLFILETKIFLACYINHELCTCLSEHSAGNSNNRFKVIPNVYHGLSFRYLIRRPVAFHCLLNTNINTCRDTSYGIGLGSYKSVPQAAFWAQCKSGFPS